MQEQRIKSVKEEHKKKDDDAENEIDVWWGENEIEIDLSMTNDLWKEEIDRENISRVEFYKTTSNKSLVDIHQILDFFPNLRMLLIYDDPTILYNETISVINNTRLTEIYTPSLIIEDFYDIQLPCIQKITIENYMGSDIIVSSLFKKFETLKEVVIYNPRTDLEIVCDYKSFVVNYKGRQMQGELLFAEEFGIFQRAEEFGIFQRMLPCVMVDEDDLETSEEEDDT